MIDMLIEELVKGITEAEVQEKDSQADYEKATKDATAKRTADAKAIAEKEGVKADLEAMLHKHGHAVVAKSKQVETLKDYIKEMHSECDWLEANYEVRKTARASEKESLMNAKA